MYHSTGSAPRAMIVIPGRLLQKHVHGSPERRQVDDAQNCGAHCHGRTLTSVSTTYTSKIVLAPPASWRSIVVLPKAMG